MIRADGVYKHGTLHADLRITLQLDLLLIFGRSRKTVKSLSTREIRVGGRVGDCFYSGTFTLGRFTLLG